MEMNDFTLHLAYFRKFILMSVLQEWKCDSKQFKTFLWFLLFEGWGCIWWAFRIHICWVQVVCTALGRSASWLAVGGKTAACVRPLTFWCHTKWHRESPGVLDLKWHLLGFLNMIITRRFGSHVTKTWHWNHDPVYFNNMRYFHNLSLKPSGNLLWQKKNPVLYFPLNTSWKSVKLY